MNVSITLEYIHQFAAAWYLALDVHAPTQECRSMLAEDSLNMQFPDGGIHDLAAFQKWYEGVTNLFFDEKHTVQKIDVRSSSENQADLTVVVRWQASWWEPPAAESKRLDLESTQSWTVRRCSNEKNPFDLEITTYIARAEDFKFAPGSAMLPAPTPANTDELVRLNDRIAKMEQQADADAYGFFSTHLAHNLVFRRASGKVVGKFGDDGFLAGLKTNPFKSRVPEETAVSFVGERALVTLIIVGTRKDDGSVHRYRNIRVFSRRENLWILECWYNYEITGL